MAERHGIEPLNFSEVADITEAVCALTDGRGVDSGIDAVGMEAAGSLADSVLSTVRVQTTSSSAPRLLGFHPPGGTLSISGVYAGAVPMFPIGDLFDKQISVRMGQANVRRWTDEIVPLLTEEDPLGVGDLTTHELPLADAPKGYDMFQKKADGAIKVVLRP